MYHDTRNIVQNDNAVPGWFDVYYTFRENAAAPWSEHRLTPSSFSSSDSFFGDYSGMAQSQNKVYPVYIQLDNGDQHIYTNVITFPTGVCPWDCGDDNGSVDIVDFLTLLFQWGLPGTCDFDGGGVGITDFLTLLANWGPCP